MSRIKKLIPPLALAASFALLLALPELAAGGVKDGLALSARVILPSLFPFLVCSNLFVLLGLGDRAARMLAAPASRLLHLPPQAAAAFLLGLVGGYPAGAQLAGALYETKRLRQDEAERALAVCNQAGPSFIFGVLGGAVFHSLSAGFFLYGVQILSAVLVCRLTGKAGRADAVPSLQSQLPESFAAAFSAAVQRAGMSALHICMYVTVFSVLSAYMLALTGNALPASLRPALLGLLELSGGCAALQACSLPLSVKLAFASFFLAFGGCSILAQSHAAAQDAGLQGTRLLPFKLLQALIACALSLAFAALVHPERWSAAVISGGDLLQTLHAGTLLLCTCFCMTLRKKSHSFFGKEHV